MKDLLPPPAGTPVDIEMPRSDKPVEPAGGFLPSADDRIRDLRWRVQYLETEVYNLREKDGIPKCAQCGEQIAYHANVFRCADCAMPFHRECLRHHFRNVAPTNANL